MTAHAVPNAAVPLLTTVGLTIGELICGAVIPETVFAWPGVGRLPTVAVANRNMAVAPCISMLIALTMATANLIVDLLDGRLDPRVRVGAGARR